MKQKVISNNNNSENPLLSDRVIEILRRRKYRIFWMIYILFLIIFISNFMIKSDFFSPLFVHPSSSSPQMEDVANSLKDISTRIKTLENKVSNLEDIMKSSSNSSYSNVSQVDLANFKYELEVVNRSINKIKLNSNSLKTDFNENYTTLDARVHVIETAIIDSPERSLALYKLSNDMESLKENYKSNLDDTRKDLDRVYNFAQWFIYAIIFLSVGLIGIIMNTLRKKAP